jgi:HD-GYP domain-containing protein (c-di-GMP phosphodiesterase class II)
MRASPTAGKRRFGRRLDDPAAAALTALAEAVQVRDGATAEHSTTVGRLCGATATALGMDPEHAAAVELAGMLHDLGKVGLPDAILHKPGPLSEGEWGEVQKHPAIGAQIVAAAGLADVSQWILLHHERPDGGGYPAGLSAREIPEGASILAVCDAYDVMTSDRPYSAARSAEAAVAECREHRGRQFAPFAVDALAEVHDAAAR